MSAVPLRFLLVVCQLMRFLLLKPAASSPRCGGKKGASASRASGLARPGWLLFSRDISVIDAVVIVRSEKCVVFILRGSLCFFFLINALIFNLPGNALRPIVSN